MRKLIFILFLLVSAPRFFSCSGESNETVIAVIPKGTTQVFWQTVHAGAIKAAKELNVKINWIGTEKEDDRKQQITLVDNQAMNRISGIVLAPLDNMALRRPVKRAVQNHIPVVIMDSGLKDSEDLTVSFVATDNREGGHLAGREMAKILGGKGKVVLLRYQEGSASTENREDGFLETLKEYPGIEVVSDEQYAGSTTATAQQASENLLFRFRDAKGNLTIDGIFCVNESSTYGMLQALRRQRLAGSVKFIGFDASPPLVEGLKQKEISGLIVQNPFNMGYLSVKTMYQHLKGEKVPKRIDTGVVFVTPENMNTPEMKELISPDLEKWLSRH
ncbi:MAG TPA: sugar ABC transporter substrate-binding protein [Bacteroidetes bacterium]|nr:sugar ABC transporter substrate-binding protein [Bacteroidota bacterium]